MPGTVHDGERTCIIGCADSGRKGALGTEDLPTGTCVHYLYGQKNQARVESKKEGSAVNLYIYS